MTRTKVSRLTLPESLKIGEIEAVKKQLSKALEKDRPVCLNASDVLALDYSGLQLLLCFQRELTARGHTLSWKDASKPLKDAISYLGAGAYLGI